MEVRPMDHHDNYYQKGKEETMDQISEVMISGMVYVPKTTAYRQVEALRVVVDFAREAMLDQCIDDDELKTALDMLAVDAAPTFVVGDYVHVTGKVTYKPPLERRSLQYGKVFRIDGFGLIGVEFPRYQKGTGQCHSSVAAGHGMWFAPADLTKAG